MLTPTPTLFSILSLCCIALLPGAMAAVDTSVGSVPTGIFATNPLAGAPSPAATVTMSVQATEVASCSSVPITWTIDNDGDQDSGANLNLFYSTVNVTQDGYSPPITNVMIRSVPMRSEAFTWSPISIPDTGYYVITASGNSDPAPVVRNSPRFLLIADNTSCLSGGSGGSGDSSDAPASPTSSPADSIPATSPPLATSPSPKQGSNTGAVIGGVIAGIAVVGLIIVFFFWKRRQALVSKAQAQRTLSKRGHHKWGGLASIDKTHGEIPVVMSPNSPYGKQGINHSQSTARALTEEEHLEKGYGDDDNFIIPDVPELPKQAKNDRKSRRYSSEILAAALKDDSGLAAFNEQYAQYPATAKVPILSTTSPTTAGADDPFTDEAFIARGKRASSLSVPSTARTHSRVSDVPSSRGAPSPLPLPSSAGYQQTPPASMQGQQQQARSTPTVAAIATVSRPSRKPVPQYTEDSFELTHTSRSSPTTMSRRGSGHMSTTPISTSPEGFNDKLSSSPESASTAHHWLHERVPVANRHIGLAGQNERPVHYLIPDPPPSSSQH